jgi:hypothetical protein
MIGGIGLIRHDIDFWVIMDAYKVILGFGKLGVFGRSIYPRLNKTCFV